MIEEPAKVGSFLSYQFNIQEKFQMSSLLYDIFEYICEILFMKTCITHKQ